MHSHHVRVRRAGESDVSRSNRVNELSVALHPSDPAADSGYRRPSTLSSIRAGLTLQIHSDLGLPEIKAICGDFTRHAMAAWRQCPAIRVVGTGRTRAAPESRLPFVNFNIMVRRFGVKSRRDSGIGTGKFGQGVGGLSNYMLLHPDFVAALLNDVYGIQVRCRWP
jgi:selenocysteine lyase/cysteine desulfurase